MGAPQGQFKAVYGKGQDGPFSGKTEPVESTTLPSEAEGLSSTAESCADSVDGPETGWVALYSKERHADDLFDVDDVFEG